MLINLVFKDYLLIKKYWAFMSIYLLVLPFFFSSSQNMTLTFLMCCISMGFLGIQTMCSLDERSKGGTLMSALPYSRTMLVIARYVSCLSLFLLAALMYTLGSLISNLFRVGFATPPLSLESLALGFFAICAFVTVMLPLIYRFGTDKLRYILSIAFILTFCFAGNIFDKLHLLLPSSPAVLVGVGVVITIISCLISIAIYRKKDL